MMEQCLLTRSVSVRSWWPTRACADCLLPAPRAQTPTGNQVRDLGKCGGFSCPSSALKPGHAEHERKAEARGDADQGQPEGLGRREAQCGPSCPARSTSGCLSVPRHPGPFSSCQGRHNRKHPPRGGSSPKLGKKAALELW